MDPKTLRATITEILASESARTPPVERLFPLIYGELRRLAAVHMKREQAGHTLSPTALVHEAYLRMLGDAEIPMKSRAHVFAAAARAMRQVLVDHARRRRAAKRGFGWQRITLEVQGQSDAGREVEFLALDKALEK